MKVSPIYNFLGLAVVHILAVAILYDPCNVPLALRSDCGFPGIEQEQCVIFGKLNLVFRDVRIMAKMMIVASLVMASTFTGYKLSGFPPAVGVLYAAAGLLTFFAATRCCHNNQVPSGPHCYY